jgi:alkylation response protein AidB-like acyl-CoA dehydrogenase
MSVGSSGTRIESVDDFATRARAWIGANLPSSDDAPVALRELQNLIFDHGYAGIAFPCEYGGAGLSLDHQKAFFDVAADLDRQVPTAQTVYRVSIGMVGPTILEHGSRQAKLRFLPPLLRGDEVWIQILSEPRGGSDMAGAITRLGREGDAYVLNGAKMWSTGAHLADFGLCLCRSNWDVPKHRGLSMVAVPLKDTPGVTVDRIRGADGALAEFCQEFFDDVRLPLDNLIGEENNGWAVARALLLHERNAVSNIGHGYLTGRPGMAPDTPDAAATDLLPISSQRGVDDVLAMRIADAYIATVVGPLTSARISRGMHLGTHIGPWGSLSKLQGALAAHSAARTALAVHGPDAAIWEGDDVQIDNPATAWLFIRAHTLGGGTNEMQRNIISEGLLGLPREPAVDRNVAFGEVLRSSRGQ